MKHTTTVIIGAGQSGLAFSKQLSARSIDHIVLERGEIANSWRKERWDSLRLLTPNWQSRLPGFAYTGNDPDGYMTMTEVTRFLEDYAAFANAPVQESTTVLSVRQVEAGYIVKTDQGDWHCAAIMLANGACNIASVPRIAEDMPSSMRSLTSMEYKNPDCLEDAGVMIVGASASGVQIAKEIQASGRQVTLCVGEHVRLPRLYRGRDIKWWMDAIDAMDMSYKEVDDIRRARRLPSLQLVGTPERITLDLNTLRQEGVEIVGRLAGMHNGTAQFSGSLANQCALADLKMNRLLDSIDEWASSNAMEAGFDAMQRFDPTQVDRDPRLALNMESHGIKTIIWATGYRPDYSWLHVPVFDRKGNLRHDGGIVEAPGMYVMGLPFLRRRKSSFIDGACDDARDLANHLNDHLFRAAA